MTSMFFLGIDISKAKFDVALLTTDAKNSKPKSKTLPNSPQGFEQLQHWLRQNLISSDRMNQLHVALEATGIYGQALARFLYDRGCTVSVVNPAAIAAFAKSEMSRNKTDKADAIRIARYVQALRPAAWVPPAPEVVHLQALSRRRDALLQMRQMEASRLESAPVQGTVRTSIEVVLTLLDAQITAIEKEMHDHIKGTPSLKESHELLDGIPGIAEITANAILAELPDIASFESAAAVAAFAGLSPSLKESGSSVRGRPRLSKVGSARLRRALYFPAVAAIRHNPAVTALAERLRARGKTKMAIIGAAMRKLLHLVYGVLKSRRPFDRSYHLSHLTAGTTGVAAVAAATATT